MIAAQLNASLPRWFQLFLGVAEILAAAGIMIVMISATGFHLMRGEISSAVTTFVLLALATFVDFLNDKAQNGSLTLEPGQHVRFRHRVIIHPGASRASLATMYKQYAQRQ